MFQDISIQRLDRNGDPVAGQLIKIPIDFAQKQKWFVRLTQDPNAGQTLDDGSPVQRQIEIQLPRMAFELTNIQYDPTRKMQSSLPNVSVGTSNTYLNKTFSPVPYNFSFVLTIASKNIEDMFQIVEQILPYFTPSFTVTILESQLPLSKDIQVVLLPSDNFKIEPYGDLNDLKILTCELNFQVYGYIYGPKRETPIITESQLNLFASTFMPNLEDIEVYPYTDPTPPTEGVTITATPNPSDALPNSDFGVTLTVEEN